MRLSWDGDKWAFITTMIAPSSPREGHKRKRRSPPFILSVHRLTCHRAPNAERTLKDKAHTADIQQTCAPIKPALTFTFALWRWKCAFILLIHTRILIKGFKPISIHKDHIANTYMVNGILCQDISRESRYLHRDNTLVLKLTHTRSFFPTHRYAARQMNTAQTQRF